MRKGEAVGMPGLIEMLQKYQLKEVRRQKSDQILTLFGLRRSSRMEIKKHVAATIIIEAPEVKLKV